MARGRSSSILATGSYLPTRLVPNAAFEAMVDTSDAWIFERTGIRERHFVGPGETTATLAAEAAAAALEACSLPPGGVDLLIVATTTPERIMPNTAAFVERRMGMACPGFDVNVACAGFVYALALADAQIRSGMAERVLVVGAEVYSSILDMTDRSTCVLFGDGAGAVLLAASEEPGIVDSVMAMDAREIELLTVPAGGAAEPASSRTVAERRHYLRMASGQTVYRLALDSMAEASLRLLEKAGATVQDVSLVVGHQANARILTALGRRLGVSPERVVLDLEHVANTAGASIPIALDRAWRAGLVAPGDLILTPAFGAGLAWGANLVRWTAPPPAP